MKNYHNNFNRNRPNQFANRESKPAVDDSLTLKQLEGDKEDLEKLEALEDHTKVFEEEKEAVRSAFTPKQYRVKAAQLNLRKTPEVLPDNVVDILGKGAVVIANDAEEGEFLYVTCGGLKGYVMRSFVEEV